MCNVYALAHFSDTQKKEKTTNTALEGSKKMKKQHYSSRREKKVAWVEDTIDPFTYPPKCLILETQEFVAAFKGVVPFSRYASDSLLSL